MRTSPVVVLLALALTTAGCGDDSTDAGSEPSASPTAAATSAPPTTSPGPSPTTTSVSTVSVYLLQGEKVQPVRRTAEGSGVAAAAVRALLAGPTSAERSAGLTSAVPAGTTLRSLSVSDGLATVDLSGAFDDGGGSLSMQARVAQVVFTLTRFASVQRVSFRLDGRAVTALGGEGVDVDKVGRTDYEDLSPAVLIESPRWGDSVRSEVNVAGTANTFEAEFRLELKDSTGKVLADKQVMATSGSGTRGTFEKNMGHFDPGSVTLTAYTLSAKDGSRVDESVVQLRILPGTA